MNDIIDMSVIWKNVNQTFCSSHKHTRISEHSSEESFWILKEILLCGIEEGKVYISERESKASGKVCCMKNLWCRLLSIQSNKFSVWILMILINLICILDARIMLIDSEFISTFHHFDGRTGEHWYCKIFNINIFNKDWSI